MAETTEKAMVLAEKTYEVFTYAKTNGGKVSIDEMVAALGRTSRSISASITDLTKKALGERVKEEAGEGEKPVTYLQLNDAGLAFVQPE